MTTPPKPDYHCELHDEDFVYDEEGGCPNCVDCWISLEEEEEDADSC